MQKIEPSELIFMTDGSFRGCKRIKREVIFSFIYICNASRAGIPGSRPARSKNELGWRGPGRGCYIYIYIYIYKNISFSFIIHLLIIRLL